MILALYDHRASSQEVLVMNPRWARGKIFPPQHLRKKGVSFVPVRFDLSRSASGSGEQPGQVGTDAPVSRGVMGVGPRIPLW